MFQLVRRALKSRLALVILAIILLAFVITGISAPTGLGGAPLGGGEAVATVGGKRITASDIQRRAQQEISAMRQQDPTIDMARFIAQGGIERVVSQLIDSRALEAWGHEHGFGASAKAIDGEIASVPAFAGLTGKFDQSVFEQVMAQQKLNPQQIRNDVAGDLIRRQMLVPAVGGAQAAIGTTLPYVEMLLEGRTGSIGIVPAAAMAAGPAPTPAEIEAHYRQHIDRFTAPERRVLRYATFQRSTAEPTEAEIAAFYKANAAQYAGRQTRTLSQVIQPTQAAAAAFAAKVNAGTPFAAAAQARGFAPADTVLGDFTAQMFAQQMTPEVAKAAFAAPTGGLTAPIRSPLGWHVIRVDRINDIPATALADARGDIVTAITKTKGDEAMAAQVAAIEDALAEGDSFDDIVRTQKLTPVVTPPLFADGRSDAAGWVPAPTLTPLLKPAFETAPDEDPTVEAIEKDRLYALLSVTQVVAPAPRPLAQVSPQVAADIQRERALARSRTVAQGILAKVNAGTPVARAFTEAPVRLTPPERASARQVDLLRAQDGVPAPIALLFSMKAGDTKLLAMPRGEGWFVVDLETVNSGDPKADPALVQATRAQFGQALGNEYAAQFVNAARAEVGVKRDDAALARLKAQLGGSGSAAP